MTNFLELAAKWPSTPGSESAYLTSFKKAITNFEIVLNEERAMKSPPHGRINSKRKVRT